MLKRCDWCGKDFQAVRRTAKYCSDHCRVSAHRYKDYTVKKPFWQALESVRSMGRSMEHKKFHYESVDGLLQLQQLINHYLPDENTVWRCDRCSRTVKRQSPYESDCECGAEKSQWYMVPKLFKDESARR